MKMKKNLQLALFFGFLAVVFAVTPVDGDKTLIWACSLFSLVVGLQYVRAWLEGRGINKLKSFLCFLAIFLVASIFFDLRLMLVVGVAVVFAIIAGGVFLYQFSKALEEEEKRRKELGEEYV